MPLRVFSLLVFTAVLALVAPPPAWSVRPWYHTAHAGKPYVNPDLTPDRVLGKTDLDPSWEGQLVLWQGRIRSLSREGFRTSLELEIGGAVVPVLYRYKAVNLETDRVGYRVAVKGIVLMQDGHFSGLQGRSLILLQPPAVGDYEAYLRANPTQKRGLQSFLAWWVSFHNAAYSPSLRDTVAAAIVEYAGEYQIDPLFLASLIQIESAFRVDIVSPSGAIGLGQLMPFTARGLGVDPHNPRENVRAAARYISSLIRSWEHDAPKDPRALALAGYNAGPSLVRSVHGIPAIPQTTNYVYFIGFVYENMSSAALRAGVLPKPSGHPTEGDPPSSLTR